MTIKTLLSLTGLAASFALFPTVKAMEAPNVAQEASDPDSPAVRVTVHPDLVLSEYAKLNLMSQASAIAVLTNNKEAHIGKTYEFCRRCNKLNTNIVIKVGKKYYIPQILPEAEKNCSC